jgi:hypothetical protein
MRRAFKGLGVILGFAIAPFVCMAIAYLLIWATAGTINHFRRPKVHEITTPLDPAVVQDMCAKLDLRPGDKRCREGAIVYAPDFFPEIKSVFRSSDEATYDQVQELFGKYQYECEDPVYTKSTDRITFNCYYDLHTDRRYRFSFMFRDDGKLLRIYASRGGGGL